MATPDGYHYPMFGSMLISAGICCWILYRPCGLILRIIFGAVFALGFLGSLVSILRRLIFLHFPGIEAILSVVMCAYGVLGMYLGYSHKYATYLLPFTEDEAAEANKRYSIH